MASLRRSRWVLITMVGVLYVVIGYGSTLLDHPFPGLHFWRLAAWIASAMVYVGHLYYEHFRAESSPITTSINVGLAVALGGFLLAVAATTHAVMVTEHAPFTRLLVAWVAWPLITGLPAFMVALVITFGLRALKIPRRATP